MKRLLALLMLVLGLSSCGDVSAPSEPPKEIIEGTLRPSEGSSDVTGNSSTSSDTSITTSTADASTTESEDGLLKNVVTVQIGLVNQTVYSVDMYDIAQSHTMLTYVSSTIDSDRMRFPTYTYEFEGGFVSQNIRGSYSKDSDVVYTDVKAGEVFLVNGNQLRLYFKDMNGLNLRATKVGILRCENTYEVVTTAHDENVDDYWQVEVYFLIQRNY